MSSFNELNDREEARIIRKIRRRANKELESIKTVRDRYGCKAYMVIDDNRNVIVDGGIVPLDLKCLAERYGVTV